MNYFLLPSLQHAATVKTASLLYNDLEIENILENSSISLREQWKQIEEEIASKLPSFLPPPLQNAVAKVIRPMHAGEVDEWKINHDYLLGHLGECCSAWLVWKTNGTINRTETAKKIVANENIDPKIRFVLACTYFLEEEVVALWKRIKTKRKRGKRLVLGHTNEAVEIFKKWLAKKESRHWTEMVDEYLRIERNAGPTVRQVPTRVSCYFPFLSKELRLEAIEILSTPRSHSDDFQLCLNNMDEAERIEALKCQYPIALTVCFKWPYRSLFIKMAKEVFGHLPSGAFTMMLRMMLREYIFEADDDFHLFEEFWQISPANFKEEAKKTEFFISEAEKYIKMKDCPQALREILTRCFFD